MPTQQNLDDLSTAIETADYPAASALLRPDWPLLFYWLAAKILAKPLEGVSTSSVAIGTGSKSFTLTVPKGWKAGTPVLIMADSDPLNKYMAGKLTVNETAGGVITVNVTTIGGTGTLAAWTIIAGALIGFVVPTPPVTVADGGTGATTAAGARTNFEIVRRVKVKGWRSSPPGSPSTGDLWLVGDAPTGAWASQEAKWATWDGAAWTFEAPADGDLTYVLDSATDGEPGVLLVYGGISTDNDLRELWPGAGWSYVAAAGKPRSWYQGVSVASGTYVATRHESGKHFNLEAGTVLTLPNGLADYGVEFLVSMDAGEASNGTVDVQLDGLIRYNGSSVNTITVQPGHAWWFVRGTVETADAYVAFKN